MIANLRALIKACENTGVDYKCTHSSQRLVEVWINRRCHLFISCITPLNYQSLGRCFLDKDYFYTVFRDAIQMPRSQAFLNPDGEPRYAPYVKQKNLAEILDAIEAYFGYPAIVKRNSGQGGENVFQVNHRSEAKAALQAIFDPDNQRSDRIALAQEYLHIATEYRVIYLNGSLSFAYEKNIDRAECVGNLSPLHWAGAKAIVVEDETLLSQIERFCQPLFEKTKISFCGLDVAVDRERKWWLIEANSCPNFAKVIADGGEYKVIEMYEQMLALLSQS